jgi:hypothetical protein
VLASLAKLEALAITILGTIGIFLNDIALNIVSLNFRPKDSLAIVTGNAVRVSDAASMLRRFTARTTVTLEPTFIVGSTIFPPSLRLESSISCHEFSPLLSLSPHIINIAKVSLDVKDFLTIT